MKKKTQQRITAAAVMIFTFVAVAAGLTFLNIGIGRAMSQSVLHTLKEIMEQQAFNFNSELIGASAFLRSVADAVAFAGGPDAATTEMTERFIEDGVFEYIYVTGADGREVTGRALRISENDLQEFSKAAQSGDGIDVGVAQSTDGKDVVVAMQPILENGAATGYVFGVFASEKLNELFLSSFGGDGYAYIADQDGTIIAETRNRYNITTSRKENLYTTWEQATFYEGSLEEIIENAEKGNTGYVSYGLNQEKRLMYYAPIGINDWYIYSIVPEQVIARSAETVLSMVFTTTVLILILFAGLLIRSFLVRKKHIKQLSNIAFIDEVTGAPTLVKFKIDAARLLEENSNTDYVLIQSDIDGFKMINQIFGFKTGNYVLKTIADTIGRNLNPEREVYARSGADVFLILREFQSDKRMKKEWKMMSDHFRMLIEARFEYDIRFPTGFYYLNKDGGERNIADAMERANIAHRRAKQTELDVCVFDESMLRAAVERKQIENQMEAALKKEDYKLFLQPKYDLHTQKFEGAEALVRWKMGGRTFLYPNKFIPIFEENGFIIKLDTYMFEKVCAMLREWLDQGVPCAPVSVNFSRLHLNDPGFVEKLCEIAERYDVPKELLEIELTETTIFDHEEALPGILDRLHDAGFLLSMDDFGIGYSSLGLLKNIPVDTIKIDRSFFMNTPDFKRAKIVLMNVIRMAKELGIKTVAEGIESREYVELLNELGCDMVQGYYFAKPMPDEEYKSLLLGEHVEHEDDED